MFTSTQRDAVMRYLGYPATAQDTRYAAYYPIFSQLDLIGGDPVTQAPVDALLVELDALDAVLAAAGTTIKASGALKRVDEIEFYDSSIDPSTQVGVGTARRVNVLVRRLAQRMGGEHLIMGDYFGGLALAQSNNELNLG